MMFDGMRVITSVWLTQPGEPYEARRTWRERLLSRPWLPWQATKTVVPQVPYQGAVQLNRNTLVLHPAVLKQLQDKVPEVRWR